MKANPELKVADSPAMLEKNACLNDAKKRMQLFWRAHSKKRQFDDDDFKDIALNLIHPDPNQRMEIKQIMAHKWVVKGPCYNEDQLRLYLTQRVKHVLQGRARKIRKLMQDHAINAAKTKQETDPHYYTGKGVEVMHINELKQRMEEIDPKKLFTANAQSTKDEGLPSSLFQFMTNKSPVEIAARLEKACAKLGGTIKINAEDNAMTLSAGCDIITKLPDDSRHSQKEEVYLGVKQFILGELPKDLKSTSLRDRDDVTYVVSFKRLRASPKAYEKIASRLFEHPALAQAMNLEDFIDDEVDKKSTVENGNDEEKSADNL